MFILYHSLWGVAEGVFHSHPTPTILLCFKISSFLTLFLPVTPLVPHSFSPMIDLTCSRNHYSTLLVGEKSKYSGGAIPPPLFSKICFVLFYLLQLITRIGWTPFGYSFTYYLIQHITYTYGFLHRNIPPRTQSCISYQPRFLANILSNNTGGSSRILLDDDCGVLLSSMVVRMGTPQMIWKLGGWRYNVHSNGVTLNCSLILL